MSKIVLLFSGQGSQYAGMGRHLCDEFAVARQTFTEADEVLGFDLKKICFEGRLVELNKLEILFPALLTFSVALFRTYMEAIGIVPHFAAGHSLGEYSALVSSGMMDFSDAIRIVHQRGIWAKEVFDSQNGTMTVVNGVNEGIVNEACGKISDSGQMVFLSCFNAPDQFVISGHQRAVMKAEDELITAKAQITPLIMSPPFHCPLMQPAADKLRIELKKCTFHPPSWPVISNVTAKPFPSSLQAADNLSRQLIQPVKWSQTMDYLEDQGVESAVEMGPQAVLTNLLALNKKNFEVVSFGQRDDRQRTLEIFHRSGRITEPEGRSHFIIKCLAAAVCCRNRNWDKESYRKGVKEPYESIESIQDKLDQTGSMPTSEQMTYALEMLRTIFATKRVPLEEQDKRFKRIVIETGTHDIFKDFKMPVT